MKKFDFFDFNGKVAIGKAGYPQQKFGDWCMRGKLEVCFPYIRAHGHLVDGLYDIPQVLHGVDVPVDVTPESVELVRNYQEYLDNLHGQSSPVTVKQRIWELSFNDGEVSLYFGFQSTMIEFCSSFTAAHIDEYWKKIADKYPIMSYVQCCKNTFSLTNQIEMPL